MRDSCANWRTPDGKRALSQEDAIEALDVGEVEGWTMNVPSGGVYAFSDEEVEKILRQLPAWEPLVDIFRDAVREVVREELRRSRRKT